MILNLKNIGFGPQDKKQSKSTNQKVPLKEITVRIFSNDRTMTKNQKQLGRFHSLDKSYFYKERILLFYMLKFIIQKRNVRSKKIRLQCDEIFCLFNESVKHFKGSIKNQQHMIRLGKNNYFLKWDQNFSKIRFQSFLIKLEDLRSVQDLEIFDWNDQLQLFLDVLLEKWVRMQRVNESFFADFQNIIKQKITIENVNNQQKIIPLTILVEEQQHNNKTNETVRQGNQKQKQLLYRNLMIRIGGQKVAQIIETNQQKYVFFKIEQNLRSNSKKISRLIRDRDKQDWIQSQGQETQSERNSIIVQDEQFYRMSQKIQLSCRKNSSNSDEKQQIAFVEQNLCPRNNSFNSQSSCKCQKNNQNFISQIYTRSSSLEKGSLLKRDNPNTSIVLFEVGGNFTTNKRKQSCQNTTSYHKSGWKDQQIMLLNKVTSNAKINLFDEARANLQSEGFNFACYGYSQTSLSRQLGQVGRDTRDNLSRPFLKQNIPQQKS